MELLNFIKEITDFESLKPREKILLFAWFLHAHRNLETFDNALMRQCFRDIAASDPNVARELPRMADRKPPDLLRVRGGYMLEGSIKRALDTRYGNHPTTVAVTKLLTELPAKIPDSAERTFLNEALDCYRVGAFRSAIVMTWNLAFSHFTGWILADQKRLSDFNKGFSSKYPKRVGMQVANREDFEEIKESEIIEAARTGAILSKNITEILREKLKKRNMAAHPSSVIVTQSQTDDVITDLVNNVVLVLK